MMYVDKFSLSFWGCGAEHSCRFLNKAKRKVKKHLPKKAKQMGPEPGNSPSKSGNNTKFLFLRLIGQW